MPSAGPALCSPCTALPPGGTLPADPVDPPGHVTSALAGRGVGEVLLRAAPRPVGAGVVNLPPVPPLLMPHGELQGWPCGHCCGQAAPSWAPAARPGIGTSSSAPATLCQLPTQVHRWPV